MAPHPPLRTRGSTVPVFLSQGSQQPHVAELCSELPAATNTLKSEFLTSNSHLPPHRWWLCWETHPRAASVALGQPGEAVMRLRALPGLRIALDMGNTGEEQGGGSGSGMVPGSGHGDGIGQRTAQKAPSLGSALPSRHPSRAAGMNGPGAQGSTAVPQPGGDTGAAWSRSSAALRYGSLIAPQPGAGGRRAGALSAPRTRSGPDVAGSGWLSSGDGASLGSVRPPGPSGTVWGGLSAGPPRSSGRPSLPSPCVPRRRNVPLGSHGGRSAVPTLPGATGTALPSRARVPYGDRGDPSAGSGAEERCHRRGTRGSGGGTWMDLRG